MCLPSLMRDVYSKLEHQRMSLITSTIPYNADRAHERLSNVSFGVGVAIVLILLAILSIATGVALTVDPVAFPTP